MACLFLKMLRRLFFTGLAATIPIVITIYVIIGLFYFVDGFLGKPLNRLLEEYIGYSIPGLGFVIAILFIFLLGVLVHLSRIKFFRWFFKWLEKLFFKIPLVDKIYFPIKTIADFLFFPAKKNFKTAVLIEYPRKGIHSLGFLTNENSLDFKEKNAKKFYSVFIPSSPSPITGFTIIVEEKDITFLELSVEEAIKMVVSGGLINP